MGLINFMVGAGKRLFGKDEAPNAEALSDEVADLGLDLHGAEITVEGDKVVLSGGAMSAEDREKVILAIGNVEGVAAVEANKPMLTHPDKIYPGQVLRIPR